MNNRKKSSTVLLIILALIFWVVTFQLVHEYDKILLEDYSYLKTMWEVFKISWWRAPIMIFCILAAFT